MTKLSGKNRDNDLLLIVTIKNPYYLKFYTDFKLMQKRFFISTIAF